ncbi:hypothetical protein [Flavobacterium columnare]|nr:hypothetical protein [Flavobacterium columnare]
MKAIGVVLFVSTWYISFNSIAISTRFVRGKIANIFPFKMKPHRVDVWH